jgi:hypothetical protein
MIKLGEYKSVLKFYFPSFPINKKSNFLLFHINVKVSCPQGRPDIEEI